MAKGTIAGLHNGTAFQAVAPTQSVLDDISIISSVGFDGLSKNTQRVFF